jgi:hypothetical protein
MTNQASGYTIKTGSNGIWRDVSIDALVEKTGFVRDTLGLVDAVDLCYHAADCYPLQDWRAFDPVGGKLAEFLVDDFGEVIEG